MAIETIVRTYKSQGEFQNDAQRLARDGWTVSNTMERQPGTGCLRGCTLGLMALVWKPKPQIVVTYSRGH